MGFKEIYDSLRDKERLGVTLNEYRTLKNKAGNKELSLDAIHRNGIPKQRVIDIEKGRTYNIDTLIRYLDYLHSHS